jgi:hypothetical protein
VDRPQVEALEARIWVAFGRGELDEAARRLVEGYGPLILGYLVRTMGSEPEAWEVFAQFSEDLLRGLPGFEGRNSFKTWAYRLATNARARYWKEPYRQRGQRLATDEMQHLEAEGWTLTRLCKVRTVRDPGLGDCRILQRPRLEPRRGAKKSTGRARHISSQRSLSCQEGDEPWKPEPGCIS